MLVHHLHVRTDVAGRPQVQKHGECGGAIAVNRFELWREAVSRYLPTQSDIQE